VTLTVTLLFACSKPTGTSVVLVTIDTLRADHLGAYGSSTETPNLDQLAREGSLFLDTTAQSPLTLPSHSSILTGTTPIYHGVRDNGRYRLPEQIDTLAEILERFGYTSAAFIGGMPVHSRFGLNQGFHIYDEGFSKERPAAEVVTAARQWLEDESNRPFFLWIHLFDPHSPYVPPEGFSSPYGDTYQGEVAYVDQALGPLLSFLGNDVLTIVTSDHGESLGEHGEDAHALFIYDATLKVPLIMRGPGVPRGAVFREQVRSIDIAPSILDLLGQADSCPACQGRSLVGLMRGEEVESEASYAETYFPRLNLGWSELRSLRWKGWKYIAAPEPELYDLTSDPKELENLAKGEPEKIVELAAELSRIQTESAGPIDALSIMPDETTLRHLRSLGYVSSETAPPGEGPLPDPKSRVALWQKLMKAVDLSDEGKVEQAIGEFQSILQQDSGMLLARDFLAEAYFRLGRYEAAASQCSQILEIDPENFKSTQLLGECLFRLGRIREAERTLQKAAELDRASSAPLARLANLHFEIGDIKKARQALDRAVERDARDSLVLLVQGKLLLVEGKPVEAERALRDALASNPFEEATIILLANLLVDQKRFGEAEELLSESVSELSKNVTLYATLGRVQGMSGSPKRAIQTFEKALDLAPESPLILTSLGIAYLQSNAEEKGIELLKRSLELDPNQPQISSYLSRYGSQ
jgi:arylsulfatase A-like enzyme/predicted Zn-dependent protease